MLYFLPEYIRKINEVKTALVEIDELPEDYKRSPDFIQELKDTIDFVEYKVNNDLPIIVITAIVDYR